VAIGIESRRLALILGVVGKRTGRDFTDKDVFVAAAGGATTNEPAADLAIALAVASSADGIALPTDAVAVGELGLAGELRAVPSPQRRLNEAARLGLGSAFVPRSTSAASGVNVIHVDDVNDAMERALAPRDVRSTGRS
jgi:DNA repair protein RadA/Sms